MTRATWGLACLALGMGGCTSETMTQTIDRTGFDLDPCAEGIDPFDRLTPGVAVDYFALRHPWGSERGRGERCGGATDVTACEAALDDLPAPGDPWATGPGGGAPAPTTYFLYTRGDEVGAVGTSALGAFLAPIENAADAAYLAQVATLGAADCSAPSVRAVAGGFEVVTRTVYPCGGAVHESLVHVDESGAVTVLEQVVVEEGRDELCP